MVACTGGTLYDPGTEHPRYVVLAYGTTWKQGGLTCSSATTGVTCENGHGHGVFLARLVSGLVSSDPRRYGGARPKRGSNPSRESCEDRRRKRWFG